MAGEKILVVDDDPDIRDVLRITLEAEGYQVLEAGDGEEALRMVRQSTPHLLIVDFVMPRLNGHEVCSVLKKDLLLRHLPVIMLTGKGETSDKVRGMEAGADDYVVKPFEPKELLVRVKTLMRRTASALDANPLTRLPGNVSIANEISARIDKNEFFAVCYIDLDQFKSLNDRYGFTRGDQVISETARILLQAVETFGDSNDFVGHEGGDDFVVVTSPQKAETICQKIVTDFDIASPTFYNEEDRKQGYLMGLDRKGKRVKVPLVTVSIGIVTNESRRIEHVAEVGEIGAELKHYAKSLEGSKFVKERRQEEK